MILLYVILCTADEALKDGVCTLKLLVKTNKNGTLATDLSILPADGCATVCSFALTSQSREDSTQLTRICRKSEGYLSVFILLTLTLEGEFPPPTFSSPFSALPSLSSPFEVGPHCGQEVWGCAAGPGRARPPNVFSSILGVNLHAFDCLAANNFLFLLPVKREFL